MKNNQKNETFSSAWDNNSSSAWPAQEEAKVEAVAVTEVQQSAPAPAGYIKYRAIFEFEARNSDELSLQPGDIVMVLIELILNRDGFLMMFNYLFRFHYNKMLNQDGWLVKLEDIQDGSQILM